PAGAAGSSRFDSPSPGTTYCAWQKKEAPATRRSASRTRTRWFTPALRAAACVVERERMPLQAFGGATPRPPPSKWGQGVFQAPVPGLISEGGPSQKWSPFVAADERSRHPTARVPPEPPAQAAPQAPGEFDDPNACRQNDQSEIWTSLPPDSRATR